MKAAAGGHLAAVGPTSATAHRRRPPRPLPLRSAPVSSIPSPGLL